MPWGEGVGLLEEPTYRLYQCRRCGVQVQICPRCDHGNIYCAGECSRLARRECMRRAGIRASESVDVPPKAHCHRPQGICAFCAAVLAPFARLHPWRWSG